MSYERLKHGLALQAGDVVGLVKEIDKAHAEIARLRAEADKFGETLVALRKKYRGEIARLRALLTAPVDDEEGDAADITYHEDAANTWKQVVAAAFAVRARRMRGDTDE